MKKPRVKEILCLGRCYSQGKCKNSWPQLTINDTNYNKQPRYLISIRGMGAEVDMDVKILARPHDRHQCWWASGWCTLRGEELLIRARRWPTPKISTGLRSVSSRLTPTLPTDAAAPSHTPTNDCVLGFRSPCWAHCQIITAKQICRACKVFQVMLSHWAECHINALNWIILSSKDYKWSNHNRIQRWIHK